MVDFWSPNVWLPPNVTWEQFEDRQDYAQFGDLLYPFPMAMAIIIIRRFMEIMVFKPLGTFLKIKHRKPPPPNAILENEWQISMKIQPQKFDIPTLSKRTGISEAQVNVWFRKKAQSNKASPLDKFSETGWRWFFYTCAHLGSVFVLWDKTWVWNTAHCWYNYPFHPIDSGVWWHYMLEMSFYWSLLFTQFFDVKRKDFWEMFIHHMATLALLVFSFSNHMHRMGSLVLAVHDLADHWLELAKLLNYAEMKVSCDVVFTMFTLFFTFSRLGLFPSWIIYSTVVEASQFVQMFPVYYIFNFLMTLLLILHIIWSYYTLVIAFRAITTGDIKDSRSDSEDSSED